MTEITTINLFYPILFTITAVVLVVLICSTKAVLIRFKDKNSEDFRFKTHCDEHIDTTEKMKEIVLPKQYENELHQIETNVKDNTDRIARVEKIAQALNDKFDIIINRIVELEKK